LNSIFRVAASVAALLTLSSPLATAGQIYRCTGNDGSVAFSNLACPPNTTASTFTVKPNLVDISELRYPRLLEQRSSQDEIYTGAAVVEIGRRDQADAIDLTSTVRGRPSADATLAERIREAKDADARRRALRP
jgi:hypothetical protein